MAANRRVHATLSDVSAGTQGDRVGVHLGFRALRTRPPIDRIDDFAALGPDLCIPSVAGLGKVLRILRAARLAVPDDPTCFVGQPENVAALLERAVGTSLVLELRSRSRIRFHAWLEEGVATVDDVAEVLESPDAYLVMRHNGRFPVRVPREAVVRKLTECESWYEVLGIERG